MGMMESNAKEENIEKMRLRGGAAGRNYYKLDYERDEAFEEIEEFDEENFVEDKALEEIEEFANDVLEEIEESSKRVTQSHDRWDQVNGRLKWTSVSENGQ